MNIGTTLECTVFKILSTARQGAETVGDFVDALGVIYESNKDILQQMTVLERGSPEHIYPTPLDGEQAPGIVMALEVGIRAYDEAVIPYQPDEEVMIFTVGQYILEAARQLEENNPALYALDNEDLFESVCEVMKGKYIPQTDVAGPPDEIATNWMAALERAARGRNSPN